MTYDQLRDLARDAGARDPTHVAEISRTAVILKGENAADILAQIKRSQPALFFSRPPKQKRKP